MSGAEQGEAGGWLVGVRRTDEAEGQGERAKCLSMRFRIDHRLMTGGGGDGQGDGEDEETREGKPGP